MSVISSDRRCDIRYSIQCGRIWTKCHSAHWWSNLELTLDAHLSNALACQMDGRWAPRTHRTKSRSQKGRQQEVWAQRAPTLLVFSIKVFHYQLSFYSQDQEFCARQNCLTSWRTPWSAISDTRSIWTWENVCTLMSCINPTCFFQQFQTKLLRWWFWYSGCEGNISRPLCLSKMAALHIQSLSMIFTDDNMKASRQKQALLVSQDALEGMYNTGWEGEWLSSN